MVQPDRAARYTTELGPYAYERADELIEERAPASDLLAMLLDEIDKSHDVIDQRVADLEAADAAMDDLQRRIDTHIETHTCEVREGLQ